jgi:Uma2 family endonuclease
VPEYWFVDLDARKVLVHQLERWRYPAPAVVDDGGTLISALFPGLALPVQPLLR